MRKLILLLGFIAVAASSAIAQTFIVDQNAEGCDAFYYGPADPNNETDNTPLSGSLREAIYRYREANPAITRIEFDATVFDGAVLACANNYFEIGKNGGDLVIDASNVDFTIDANSNSVFIIKNDNVEIVGINFTGAPQRAVQVDGVNNTILRDLTITGATAQGVQINGASNNFLVENVEIRNSQNQGIQLNNYTGTGSVIDNAIIANSGGEGVLSTGAFTDLTISNSFVYGSARSGINVNDGTGLTLTNNIVGIDENGVVSANGTDQDKSEASWGGINTYTYSEATININYAGIFLDNSTEFSINSNTVSGNDGHGIFVNGASNTNAVISGNSIGLDANGQEPAGNFGEGILVQSSSGVTVEGNHVAANGNRESFVGGGSTAATDGAKTSHMHGHGIEVRQSSNVGVYDNLVGVDATGNSITSASGASLGNDLNGIYINGSTAITVGDATLGSNVVGGNGFAFGDVHTNDSNPAENNYLFGVRHGIQLHDATDAVTDVQVKSNLVGVGQDLSSAIPNSEDGISILGFGQGSRNNIIGGDNLEDGNIVGGGNYGIAFQGSGSQDNEIYNNYIGVLDASGTLGIPTNAGAIKVQNGVTGTQIGDVGKGNYLVSNNGLGVQVIGSATIANTIVGNITSCNDLGGIALQDGGNNDFGPVYVNVAEERSTFVSGFSPAEGDRIDVYIAGDCYPTCQEDNAASLGQGKTHIGTITAADISTSNFDNEFGDGYWEFDISGITGATTDNIVVTATDANGNTSEFNDCVVKVACNPPSDISFANSNTESVICEGETTTINFSVDWPANEVGEPHKYYLFKSPDLISPVDSIIASDNSFPKSFTVSDSGYYRIRALNPKNSEFCGLTTDDSLRVRVGDLPVPGNIIASSTDEVCEDDLEKVYKVDTFEPGSTFIWNVTGASINGPSNRDSVVIDFDQEDGTVQLWVKERSGAPFSSCVSEDSTLIEIDVNPLPDPVISSPSPSECAQDTAEYVVQNPATGSSFSWTVSGGQKIQETGNSVTVVWGTSGTGTVVVEETTSAGCIGTSSTANVTLNPLPAPPVLASTDPVCTSSEYNAVINNPGTRTFSWDISGGTPASASGNSVNITTEANPADSLRILITATTTNGCSSIDPAYFAIGLNQRPVPGDISINPGLDACETDTITVSYTPSSASATPTWSSTPASFLNNNAIGAYQGRATFDVVVSESATITVSEESADGCITYADSVASVDFIMNPKPADPVIAGQTSVFCSDSTQPESYQIQSFNNTSTYSWSFTDTKANSVSTDGSSADITYGIRPFEIKVVETSAEGCESDTAELSVNVQGCIFEADFEIDGGGTVICFDPEGIDFMNTSRGDTPSSTYSWDFDLNSDNSSTPASSSEENPQDVVYSAPGTYMVRLIIEDEIDGIQLSDTADIQITVNALPTITSISGPDEVCEGDMLVVYSVNETSGSSYTWTQPNGVNLASISTQGDSISLNFPRATAQSGDVTVTETNADGCTLMLSKPVTVNSPPVSGGILRGDNGDDCEGSTVELQYNGDGTSFRWEFNGTTDASFVNPANTTSTMEVVLGSQTATVVVYATSADGCSPSTPSADTLLVPVLRPDTADYSVYGESFNICSDDVASFEVRPIETGVSYEWNSRSHTIIGADDERVVTIEPAQNRDYLLVFLTKNGCRSLNPLESKDIYRVNRPTVPSVSGLNQKYCEDSLVSISYSAADTLRYSWTLPNTVTVTSSSTSGLGLDELSFSINPKEDWSGVECPSVTASLNVEYTTLPDLEDCNSSGSYDVDVRFRIDKSTHSIDIGNLNDNGYGFVCNTFDSRADDDAKLWARWECENGTVNDLTFAWSTYQIFDQNDDGTRDTLTANQIKEYTSTGDTLEVDFSNTPIDENRDYLYYFRYEVTNPICANDVGVGVDSLLLRKSDSVDFQLDDKLVCVEDTSFIEVNNLIANPMDSLLRFTYFYAEDTIYADYVTGSANIPPYFLYDVYNDDDVIPNTYDATKGFEHGMDSIYYTLNTGNQAGYSNFIIANSMLNDSIHVLVTPEYCVVNDSMTQAQFTDTLYMDVASRPGGSIGGIDFGTSTDFRGRDSDYLYEFYGNEIVEEELNLSQLEDNYVLLDTYVRDTTEGYVYPVGKNSVTYNWGYYNDQGEFVNINSGNGNVLAHKPDGMPEEIQYALITAQVAEANDTVCVDTNYFNVSFEYIPWVPNIFSPNGDGNHDLFQIRNIAKYPGTQVKIFNRWGSPLLTIDNYDNVNNVWDGKINGKDVATGTYFYIVDFNMDRVEPVSGSVSIIR